jgi:two-component system NtrC family response regulator
MKHKLLIVDDDEDIRAQMKWALAEDYDISLAGDRAGALEAFELQLPLVVLLDLGLPPHPASPDEGMATLSSMLERNSQAKVIIVTGQGEKANALQAIGAGAYDLLAKPVDLDELKIILKRTFHIADLERDYLQLQRQLRTEAFENMLGTSPQIQDVFGAIRKVATTDAPVLILGESGTGKERAALAIHQRGARRDGPFVAINCSAIPETLLESELFGHERGSFTGAHAQRKGRIEAACGGTLFLDEIGEISLPLQVKLLRFLQEQTIERVGGRQPIPVDARVIAATNSDLKKLLEEGRFREDLYYRLAVVVITMPPLRQREGDIQLLAQEFLRRYGAESHRENLAFEPGAVNALLGHSWAGNIRELENRVKRAVIMAEGKRLTARDLELNGSVTMPQVRSLKEAREAVERETIIRALRKSAGKIAPASVELGISRPTLYELMEKLGIQRNDPASSVIQ